ncbi:hypothetical protein GQR58_001810 [Nymphon striatum]|nr:hypothetical protein GQR58_001810 [Nymphon striatum]
MKFKQIVFALLFISGIKKFTNHYIEKHYGTDGMKYFHLYADSRRKLKKCQLDLDFLLKCKIYNMFPKFLRFKLYRKSLQQSKFYRSWQTKLLNLEINNKRKRIQQLEEDLHKADTRISNNFTTIDQYLLRKRVNSNIKSFMDQTITTHQRKLSNLGINNQIAPCDPEKETIDICLKLLFLNTNTFMNFTRDLFKQFLNLAVCNSFFLFNGTCYKQTEGLGMGLPLGPTFANIFMCYHEQKWLLDCPPEFKPALYRRYIDDTFLLFNEKSHVDSFLLYLNSKHNNIKFTCETENNNSINFLDININRSLTFTTSVFRKPTFSGAGSMFEALIFDLVQLVMLLQMVDVSQVDEDLQVSITVEYGASIASKKGTQPQTKKYTPATQQRSAANLPGVSGNSAI